MAHHEDMSMDREGQVNEPVARIKLSAGSVEEELVGRDAEMFGLLWRDLAEIRLIGVGQVVVHLGEQQVKLQLNVSRPPLGY